IDEASITGESIPISKEVGSNVFAGTILENGTIQIEAELVGEDTTFGRIIELVEDAQDSKSEAERFIDRFSKYYTPAVIGLGTFHKTITLIIWIPDVSAKEFYGDNIDAVLGFLATVERESDHPLAQAVINENGESKISTVSKADEFKGDGIIAIVVGHRIAVG